MACSTFTKDVAYLSTQTKPRIKQWMETAAVLLSNEVFEMNFFKQFSLLKCPVYFFVGRKDYMTNATISEKYYKQIRAPKKQLFWFEKSAPNFSDAKPKLLQAIIINKILPGTQF